MTDCTISPHIRAHVLVCFCVSCKGGEPAVVCFLSGKLLKCETDIYSYFMVFDHYLNFSKWGLHSPDVHLLFGPNVLCSDSTRLSFVSGIRIKLWFCDVKLNTVPNRLLSLWCFLNLLLCLHLLLLFSLFSFRLGFFKTGFLSPSKLLQKGLLTLPASWRGPALSSQLQLACFGCYLLTEGLMTNSEQLYLLCWEEAEWVFMLRQRRMKPGAGALFTRRTRLACSRPQNNIQLLSLAGRECVGIC